MSIHLLNKNKIMNKKPMNKLILATVNTNLTATILATVITKRLGVWSTQKILYMKKRAPYHRLNN